MAPTEVTLDTADLTLIDLVDRAIDAGVGHSFKSPTGKMVKVLALNETWVHLEAMSTQERFTLPKNIREIAYKTAMLRSIAEDQARAN